MRPGLAKIIEKVHISRHFEEPETDLYIAANACYNKYAKTWLAKRVQKEMYEWQHYQLLMSKHGGIRK